jgi:hypothetical protein
MAGEMIAQVGGAGGSAASARCCPVDGRIERSRHERHLEDPTRANAASLPVCSAARPSSIPNS